MLIQNAKTCRFISISIGFTPRSCRAVQVLNVDNDPGGCVLALRQS